MTDPEGQKAVAAYLQAITPPQRQQDAQRLDALFQDVSGFAPQLWAGSMLG